MTTSRYRYLIAVPGNPKFNFSQFTIKQHRAVSLKFVNLLNAVSLDRMVMSHVCAKNSQRLGHPATFGGSEVRNNRDVRKLRIAAVFCSAINGFNAFWLTLYLDNAFT